MNPKYEFSFERGQFLKVVGGLASLVLLVFSAGILTGIALQMREAQPTLVAEAPKPQQVVAPMPPAPELATPPATPIADEDLPAVEPTDAEAAVINADLPAVEEEPAAAAVNDSEEFLHPGMPGRFAVQLGAFLKSDNAGVLAKKLLKKGYDVDVVAREDSHGRTWYLVRYGIFPNRAEATAMAVELKARENLEALVRPSNSM